MSENVPSDSLPPDIERLRVVRAYLSYELARVDARIRRLEEQAAGRAAAPPRERRPEPAPTGSAAGGELKWWRFVPARGDRGGGMVHRGDCQEAAGAPLGQTEARMILDEDGVQPCPRCRPELRLRSPAQDAGRP
ncbi:DUF6233 domain-containing protein [Streptomyces sp. AV19]|uniref:DUF6233 domain-containing protein n=1 Tax=Streptomyces sp. AV19 TaxID=2793068 RepID=UPI0035AC12E7